MEEPEGEIRDTFTGLVIEFPLGPLTAFPNGQPFYKWADLRWSRLKPAPGPIGTYEFEELIDGPVVRFRLVFRDGRPEVDELRVFRSKGEPEISRSTLGGDSA